MSDQRQVAAESICATAYVATASLYARISSHLGTHNYGYKILYGPPKIDPPILFFGYQPGGASSDAIEGEKLGERNKWPEKLEYMSAAWPLAIAIRAIWKVDLLQQCGGLNSVFFRSPNKATWRTVPDTVRREAEFFCHKQSRLIIDAIRPKSIMMFGFGNVPDFKPIGEPLRAKTSRLVQRGTIWGYPAAEVIHLSGARISNDNRRRIRDYLSGTISN